MAQQHVLAGRNVAAVGFYRELTTRYPEAEQVWFELGIAAAGSLDFRLAETALQQASRLSAQNAELLILIAQQFHRVRLPDLARDCYRRAAAVAPGSSHAALSLSAWLERERQLPEAWSCVENCLASNPKDLHTLYYRTFLLHRMGRNMEAEAGLRELLHSESKDAGFKSSVLHLLGVVMDALGDYAQALGFLQQSKSILQRTANTQSLLHCSMTIILHFSDN